MRFKKWTAMCVTGALLALFSLAAFNYITDPFGVFGDKVLNWYGYDITNNPRLAKFGYLETHHQEYNAYILGSSKSSSLSPEILNQYYDGARFYNMMMYGANYTHMEHTLYYLAENYTVEHIVLCLGMSELTELGMETDDIKLEYHAKPAGQAIFPFYTKFLFLNPQYGLDKLTAYASKGHQPAPSKVDVFLPELGVYNKVARDQENILNVYDYAAAIGDGSFQQQAYPWATVDVDACLAAMARMKTYCDEKGISLTVISTPNYNLEVQTYDLTVFRDYWTRLAEITSYWNFSGYNRLSTDPRYFYDTIHFRNLAGEMVLGKVYADPKVYVPENFGVYVTPENAVAVTERLLSPENDYSNYINHSRQAAGETDDIPIPILIYHHIVPDDAEAKTSMVHIGKFAADMQALQEAGYTTVLPTDLLAYVHGNQELPPKPIMISFDDGYLSNYQLAYPVLRRLEMKATISIVGWSVGRDTRLDGTTPIFPHFTWKEAGEMTASGLVEIASHSYDLHETFQPPGRYGSMIKVEESSAEYAVALTADHEQFSQNMQRYLYKRPLVFTYPYGEATVITEQIMQDLSYSITFTTVDGISRITRSNPLSLYALNRINIEEDTDIRGIIERMEAVHNEDTIN